MSTEHNRKSSIEIEITLTATRRPKRPACTETYVVGPWADNRNRPKTQRRKADADGPQMSDADFLRFFKQHASQKLVEYDGGRLAITEDGETRTNW